MSDLYRLLIQEWRVVDSSELVKLIVMVCVIGGVILGQEATRLHSVTHKIACYKWRKISCIKNSNMCISSLYN